MEKNHNSEESFHDEQAGPKELKRRKLLKALLGTSSLLFGYPFSISALGQPEAFAPKLDEETGFHFLSKKNKEYTVAPTPAPAPTSVPSSVPTSVPSLAPTGTPPTAAPSVTPTPPPGTPPSPTPAPGTAPTTTPVPGTGPTTPPSPIGSPTGAPSVTPTPPPGTPPSPTPAPGTAPTTTPVPGTGPTTPPSPIGSPTGAPSVTPTPPPGTPPTRPPTPGTAPSVPGCVPGTAPSMAPPPTTAPTPGSAPTTPPPTTAPTPGSAPTTPPPTTAPTPGSAPTTAPPTPAPVVSAPSCPPGTVPESALPVAFSHFSAKLEHGRVLLYWRTENEQNNRGFEIQRSIDGIKFERIGWVHGAGDSNNATNYNFTDRALPNNGDRIYYRLTQIDFDGTTSTSKIVSVVLNRGNQLVMKDISPNPFRGKYVTVEISTPSDLKADIKLFNLAGQLIASKSGGLTKGRNLISMDLAAAAAGMHLIVVDFANGERQTKQFILDK